MLTKKYFSCLNFDRLFCCFISFFLDEHPFYKEIKYEIDRRPTPKTRSLAIVVGKHTEDRKETNTLILGIVFWIKELVLMSLNYSFYLDLNSF